ncbi:PREDICTED: autophagy-related protein 8i-like isoform X1 [Prunus mume]|uniref:Autophagy-related protein n=1 Tax=Prunus mume TaxID=102107 RepID=A0ABM0NPC5_PRUMU|nr:PREDICTED: autophagy-related protein 8i-like isoform X1 [Prunus mume]
MGRTKSFKDEFTFEQRVEESQDIKAKYPDRVPVTTEDYVWLKLKGKEMLWDHSYSLLLTIRFLWVMVSQVLVEKYSRTDLPQMEKKKYLVPRDMSVGQFIYVLSSRLHLAHGKALFVFVKDTLPQTASLMDSVYESFKDEDGFLYMCYSTEKTFGGHANVQRYEQ